ncbi:MAG: hypothetical protein AB3N09_09435 [Tateyamaria sp.]
MKDEQNNEQEYAFSSKDLEAFLKRLGIPVNGDTMSLAFAIDFAMRRGNRGDAEAAAQELIALFQASEPTEFDERVEHNANALDRETPAANMVGPMLQLYENMSITLRAADPEERPGEIYSDEMMTRIAQHSDLPNDPLIKPWIKRIGEAFAIGGAAAARREAGGLIGHLVADGHIQDEDRARVLDTIINNIVWAESSIDSFGDADGNEDLYSAEVPENQDGAEIDLSLKEEEDRRRAEGAARAREERRRIDEEYGRRERALFIEIAGREGGLIAQLGLNSENPEENELAMRLLEQMREYELLRGGPTRGGVEAMSKIMQDIENLAADLAKRLSRNEAEAAEIAGELRGEIINEARELTRQHEAQAQRIYQEVRAEIRGEERQDTDGTNTGDAARNANDPTRDGEDQNEALGRPDPEKTKGKAADNPDPAHTTELDVQKVAIALRENGMKEARQVAMRIAGILRDEGNLPVSERDIAEDLLARAQAFIVAEDEYIRRDKAAVEAEQAKKSAAREAARKAEDPAKTTEAEKPVAETDQAEPPAQDDRRPRLSDYATEFQTISFLLAEGNPEEARAAAATLADTLRALGGDFANIDTAMVLKHVIKEDKKAQDARDAEAGPKPEADDDDLSDRASWFLMMAIDKDAKSSDIYDAIVRALIQGDKQTVGKLAKALAGHILKLYKTNVTLVEMLTAIVNAAKTDADANRDNISEFSVGDSDGSSSGYGSESSDEDDDPSDRASWFLLMALDKDDKSDKLYDALLRALLNGDKKTGGKLANALAAHILKLYKTNVTMQEMLAAIIKAAKQDVAANKETESVASSDRTRRDDEDNGAGAAAVASGKSESDSQIQFDLPLVNKVDWQSFMSIYSMDPEEMDAVADVAKLIVKKGTDSASVLKSAKDVLTRSSKKIKGAKVKNHKHFVAAIEDALIKKTESKKVVKPLKFADIPDDESENISV